MRQRHRKKFMMYKSQAEVWVMVLEDRRATTLVKLKQIPTSGANVNIL